MEFGDSRSGAKTTARLSVFASLSLKQFLLFGTCRFLLRPHSLFEVVRRGICPPASSLVRLPGRRSAEIEGSRRSIHLSPSTLALLDFLLVTSRLSFTNHCWTMAASLLLLLAAPLANAFIVNGNHMALSRIDPIVNP